MADKINLLEKIRSIKGIEIIAGLVAAVCVLILAFGGSCDNSNTVQEDQSLQYVSSLEKRISETLSQVKGAGKVKVSIAVSGSRKTVLASEKTTEKTNDKVTTTEQPLLVGGKTITLGEEYPKITGAVIVASGASNANVKINLTLAAITLLGIDESKITILTGK